MVIPLLVGPVYCLKLIKFLTASFSANNAWFEFLQMCFSRYAKYGNA